MRERRGGAPGPSGVFGLSVWVHQNIAQLWTTTTTTSYPRPPLDHFVRTLAAPVEVACSSDVSLRFSRPPSIVLVLGHTHSVRLTHTGYIGMAIDIWKVSLRSTNLCAHFCAHTFVRSPLAHRARLGLGPRHRLARAPAPRLRTSTRVHRALGTRAARVRELASDEHALTRQHALARHKLDVTLEALATG